MIIKNKIKAIIIQNFFRFGGSYLYTELTKNHNTIGFYEPFHENLVDKQKIYQEKNNFDYRRKKFNHPNLEFYFQNFPLNEKWFQEFHKSNIHTNFLSIRKESILNIQNYLRSLIDYGSSNSKLPIFKINRLYFNPEVLELDNVYKIFLFREPVSSFFSNIRLNLLKPYYDRIFNLASKKLEPFNSLWDIILMNKINHITLRENKIIFKTKKDFGVHYSVYYFIWLYGIYKNIQNDFLFINYNRLHQKDYSLDISKEIFNNCSIQVDFSNFNKGNIINHKMPLSLDLNVSDLITKFIDLKKVKKFLLHTDFHLIDKL